MFIILEKKESMFSHYLGTNNSKIITQKYLIIINIVLLAQAQVWNTQSGLTKRSEKKLYNLLLKIFDANQYCPAGYSSSVKNTKQAYPEGVRTIIQFIK